SRSPMPRRGSAASTSCSSTRRRCGSSATIPWRPRRARSPRDAARSSSRWALGARPTSPGDRSAPRCSRRREARFATATRRASGVVGLGGAGAAGRGGGGAGGGGRAEGGGAPEKPLLTAPTQAEVLSYWSRAGFFAEAAALFEIHGRVPKIKAQDESDVFLPLTPVRAAEHVDPVVSQ